MAKSCTKQSIGLTRSRRRRGGLSGWKIKHITILALGSRGDIQPYAALGKGLKAAGHRVRFITFEDFAPLVAENELDFHPIHGSAQALVTSAGADTLALIRSFGSLAESYARDLSAPYLGETDLLINQLPAGLYGFDLAEKFGVPMILAAVIPPCVVSFVFDQFYWGERIAESGVGPKPIRHTNLTVERLTEAIRLGVSNSQMRQKATELGQKIRAENGVENALQVIEKILAKRDPYELSQT